MTGLAQIPKEERPRERLLKSGADVLSLTELLAICLGSGRRGVSVLNLASELLAHFGDLRSLCEASIEALTEIKGIGEAKAIQLKAIFALAKRLNRIPGRAKYPVKLPKDVVTLIGPELREEKQEIAIVMMRDVKGCIFHHEILGIGSLSEVLIHPRELFHKALHHRAYSVILAHNHPSGDPTPSAADIDLTKLLISSGRLLGIPLDDHLIISRFSYVSFWEKGLIQNTRFQMKI